MAFVERVEPVRHPVPECDRSAADGFGDGGVFALRVAGHVDAAAERDRPGVEALGQAGLAGADDAGEHEVGCGDESAGVEDPRVVDERGPGVEVLADEHALAAQPAFGEERVRAGEGGGGVLVAGESEPAGCPQGGRAGLAALGSTTVSRRSALRSSCSRLAVVRRASRSCLTIDRAAVRRESAVPTAFTAR